MKTELLDFLVDQDQPVHQEREVIPDQRDLMAKKELLEIKDLLGQMVNLAIKETLVLLVWWEQMDQMVPRYAYLAR